MEFKFLEKSRDSWHEAANDDRKQLLASFAIAASGLLLVGGGIGAMLNGDIAGGVVELAVGSGVVALFGKIGMGEVQDFADMTTKTAIRQNQIDKLSE